MEILNIINLRTDGISDILNFCHQKILEKKGAFLVPLNPIKIIKARRYAEFQHIIDNADWVFADAWGLKWAASFLYGKKIALTPGYKVMLSLLKQAALNNHSIYLLGTTDEILIAAKKEIERQYPELRIHGIQNGFFSDSDELSILKKIAGARPQYVFVGMGEYKQERTIEKLKSIYPQAIYLGVGGSIDLVAKRQPSPPEWVREKHLEWLYRLYRQPFRLPRFKALPIFMALVLIEKVKLMIN